MSFRHMTMRNNNIFLSSYPPYSKPGLPDPLFNTSTFSSFRETVRSIFDTVLPKMLEPLICGNSKLIFKLFAKKCGLIFKFVKVSSHGYIFTEKRFLVRIWSTQDRFNGPDPRHKNHFIGCSGLQNRYFHWQFKMEIFLWLLLLIIVIVWVRI